jgi:hypothetical protein
MRISFWPVVAFYLVFVPWTRLSGRIHRALAGRRPSGAAT